MRALANIDECIQKQNDIGAAFDVELVDVQLPHAERDWPVDPLHLVAGSEDADIGEVSAIAEFARGVPAERRARQAWRGYGANCQCNRTYRKTDRLVPPRLADPEAAAVPLPEKHRIEVQHTAEAAQQRDVPAHPAMWLPEYSFYSLFSAFPRRRVKTPNPFSLRSCGESRSGCQEIVDGLVKFLWLLRHREVTGIAELQVLRAGHRPMDLHFILRRRSGIVRAAY